MLNKIAMLIHTPASSVLDIIVLSTLAVWQGITTAIAFISNEDWEKITGPHGLVFVLICGLIIVWTKSVKDDAARERRHRESIKSQEDHFKSLLELNAKTAADLTILTVASNKAQILATNAIIAMDNNIIRLTNEMVDNGRVRERQLAQLHRDNDIKK